MNSDKGCLIKDIQDGQTVHGLFLVKEMSRSETKTGKPYLILTIIDSSGELAGRVWENAGQLMAECSAGTIVSLTGQAQAYKGILQLKISTIQAVPPESADISLFLPAVSGDIKAMAAELLKLIKSVEEPHLKELLLSLFKDKTFKARFNKAPAAKAMHHAYVGGLLEHTLAVTRLADMVCGLYPSIDRDLLLSGAVLHDIGKVEEFSFDVLPFNYSDQGRLVGHMVIGIEMIQSRIEKISGFPKELATHLKHLILSHHGRYEFGSPSLPMMLEAFVLNFLDDLDAKVNYINRLGSKTQEPGYQWTDYQRTLERFLYVLGHPPQENNLDTTGSDEHDNLIDPRQRFLWG